MAQLILTCSDHPHTRHNSTDTSISETTLNRTPTNPIEGTFQTLPTGKVDTYSISS
ncbi:hypothetical protein AAFF_G00013030, partial [Aldrovandia affinis]